MNIFTAPGILSMASGPVGTTITLTTQTSLNGGIAYGSGVFCISGSGWSATSPDGVTWIYSTSFTTSVAGVGFAYCNDRFIKCFTKAYCQTSTNGLTWTDTTLPLSQPWMTPVYLNGAYYIFGNNVTTYAYSTDGVTWVSKTLPTGVATALVAAAYGNGLYIVTGYVSATVSGSYYTSTDGVNWTLGTAFPSFGICNITFGNGVFVAVGASGSLLATSTDGFNWTTHATPGTYRNSSSDRNLWFGRGQFWYGSTSLAFYSSTDGIIWTTHSTNAFAAQWLAYGNNTIVQASTANAPPVVQVITV